MKSIIEHTIDCIHNIKDKLELFNSLIMKSYDKGTVYTTTGICLRMLLGNENECEAFISQYKSAIISYMMKSIEKDNAEDIIEVFCKLYRHIDDATIKHSILQDMLKYAYGIEKMQVFMTFNDNNCCIDDIANIDDIKDSIKNDMKKHRSFHQLLKQMVDIMYSIEIDSVKNIGCFTDFLAMLKYNYACPYEHEHTLDKDRKCTSDGSRCHIGYMVGVAIQSIKNKEKCYPYLVTKQNKESKNFIGYTTQRLIKLFGVFVRFFRYDNNMENVIYKITKLVPFEKQEMVMTLLSFIICMENPDLVDTLSKERERKKHDAIEEINRSYRDHHENIRNKKLPYCISLVLKNDNCIKDIMEITSHENRDKVSLANILCGLPSYKYCERESLERYGIQNLVYRTIESAQKIEDKIYSFIDLIRYINNEKDLDNIVANIVGCCTCKERQEIINQIIAKIICTENHLLRDLPRQEIIQKYEKLCINVNDEVLTKVILSMELLDTQIKMISHFAKCFNNYENIMSIIGLLNKTNDDKLLIEIIESIKEVNIKVQIIHSIIKHIKNYELIEIQINKIIRSVYNIEEKIEIFKNLVKYVKDNNNLYYIAENIISAVPTNEGNQDNCVRDSHIIIDKKRQQVLLTLAKVIYENNSEIKITLSQGHSGEYYCSRAQVVRDALFKAIKDLENDKKEENYRIYGDQESICDQKPIPIPPSESFYEKEQKLKRAEVSKATMQSRKLNI